MTNTEFRALPARPGPCPQAMSFDPPGWRCEGPVCDVCWPELVPVGPPLAHFCLPHCPC